MSTDIPMQERILGAATTLFASHGAAGTSLQAIAEAVGIRKQSLLYHFPSKDSLREAVVDSLLTHWTEAVPRIMQAATTGADRFDSALAEALAFFQHDPARARLLLRECLDRPEAMRERLTEQLAPWLGMVTGYIRMGQESGQVRAGVDPEAYVLSVVVQIISGIALADAAGGLVEGGEEAIGSRQAQELLRSARLALFTGEGAPRKSARRQRAAPRGPTPDRPSPSDPSAAAAREDADDGWDVWR